MDGELRPKILDEAHKSRYSIHLGTNKMYQDLRKEYWWPGMKYEVTKYVSKCLTCSQVKAEHQKPYGKIQPLDIPEWKWEHITMDFITKLPRTAKGHDSIWIIMDRLMKSAHFLPIREMFSSKRLAEVFINEVVARHGMPLTIVSDRDTRFTSRFWKRFHEAMGTRLHISTAYHPQTDGQSERTIQTLEDMLRACVIDFDGSWDSHLPLAEFSYNNSYHTTIGMPPYEMLYGRRCRTPVCWGEIGQKELGSLEVVRETSESNVESVALEGNYTIQKERKVKSKVCRTIQDNGTVKPAYLSSVQEVKPAYLSSAQEGKPAYLSSAQEGKCAYLSSAQEGKSAYLSSAQEVKHAYLSSTHEEGPAHLLSAQASGLWKSVVTLLDLCLGQPRLAYRVSSRALF
ncbi:hypothetical protein L1987_32691 [Smallanthus sonchifolius]|uniref:Uncharacterized protein n=1 Tax=Smallanthus sonchifolius TaxID=185202 RepID=A0ACB9HNY3_9ASTR|nr:hypothetical protein L1987_32691 [Smallanthus sonchifolius]